MRHISYNWDAISGGSRELLGLCGHEAGQPAESYKSGEMVSWETARPIGGRNEVIVEHLRWSNEGVLGENSCFARCHGTVILGEGNWGADQGKEGGGTRVNDDREP